MCTLTDKNASIDIGNVTDQNINMQCYFYSTKMTLLPLYTFYAE